MIYNITSFPLKDCHRGRRCSCTVRTLLSVELFPDKRAADSEWPVTATQTEHAKLRQWPRKPNGVLFDIREGIFQSGSSDKEEVSPAWLPCSVKRRPSEFLSQSTSTQVLQERLRSSWVPTSILLYSFCCSSLKVSFTFPRFNPPSLQKSLKWVTTSTD